MAKIAASIGLLLLLAVAGLASARPHVGTSRQLLGGKTDDRFQFYQEQCKGQNVMVCKDCEGAGLVNANPDGDEDGGFQIWCLDSGVITRQGDGGFDNWQFGGCFSRSGTQGSTVTFTPIKDDGTC